MADHYDTAVAHVEAVHAIRDQLRSAYSSDRYDARVVARLNHDLGDALKLADVQASLAIVDVLSDIAEQLELFAAGRGSHVVQVELGDLKPEFVDDLAVPFVPAVEL